MLRLSALLLAFALVAGCDSATGPTTFNVTLFDEGGAAVATGQLTFDAPIAPNAAVGGTYRLDGDGLTASRSGRLRAECSGGPVTDDDQLLIYIDVDVADAGLVLVGGCVDGVSGGVWTQTFIGGSLPGGTFEIE